MAPNEEEYPVEGNKAAANTFWKYQSWIQPNSEGDTLGVILGL